MITDQEVLPTTAELAAQLEETRSEIAQMKALAEAANSTFEYDTTDFEEWPAPEEFVAVSPTRPVLPPPVQRAQTQVLNQEQLATQGIGLVASSVPDWNVYSERVLANAAANPAPFSRALSSGDAQVVAASLASSLAAVKTADSNRAMKLAAQSASGASGHTDLPTGDVAEWQAVVAAAPWNYWG